MEVVETWTGRHTKALLRAMRLTNEAFAERLGVAVRTVAKWNANPDLELSPELQQVLDTFLLREVPGDAKARFGLILGNSGSTVSNEGASPAVAADELTALTSWIRESNTNRDAIDQIARAAESLARAHPGAPAPKLLPEVQRLQQQTQSILRDGKQRLRETRELLKLNSDLLAHACILLGDLNQDHRAEQYGLAALMFAQEAEAPEASAWYARAKTARWQDKHVEAADLARQGYERSPNTPFRTQLAWYEANAAALFGDYTRATEAARRAEEAAETHLATGQNPSVWSFPVERQALFAMAVATKTGDADAALRAAEMADAGWASGDPRAPATWAQIRVGAGIAHLMKGSLDATVTEVSAMLDLEPEFRMATVTRYLADLKRRLAHPRFKDSVEASELTEGIREFISGALKSKDDSTEAE